MYVMLHLLGSISDDFLSLSFAAGLWRAGI